MMRIAFSLLAFAAVLAPASGSAQTREMVEMVCGANCSDSIGTQSRLKGYWSALESMGTTDYVGSSFGGITIDPSSLLSAASVAGAPELDRWLRTGLASSSSIQSSITQKLMSGVGLDVSSLTGRLASSGLTSAATQTVASAMSGVAEIPTTELAGFGGSGTATCSPEVERNLVKAAETYVESVMDVTTKSEYGLSTMGQGGMFGGSCIERMMQGSRDILFKPPQMADLLGSMSSMFGKGGGGNSLCEGMDPMQQLADSMPRGLFTTGSGGFFPSIVGKMGGDDERDMLTDRNGGVAMVSQSSVVIDGINSIF